MVRSKLESGAAAAAPYSTLEFFRDLRLLCANATLFFPRRSPESIAAAHLRKLVNKEFATALPRPSEPPKPAAADKRPTPTPPVAGKLKSETTSSNSLVEKPRTASLPPLVACKKRSSVAGKVEARVVKKEERGGKAEAELEPESPAKKRKKETPEVSGTKGLRSNKNRGGGGNGHARSPTPTPPRKSAVENRNENKAASRTEKKSSNSGSGARKGSAADLLSRMKQRSPPEATKTSSSTTRGAEQKKGSKGDGRRDYAVRPSGSGVSTRQTAEKGGLVRRGVGRPPKSAAVLPTKRGREEVEAAPRKRGRR